MYKQSDKEIYQTELPKFQLSEWGVSLFCSLKSLNHVLSQLIHGVQWVHV